MADCVIPIFLATLVCVTRCLAISIAIFSVAMDRISFIFISPFSVIISLSSDKEVKILKFDLTITIAVIVALASIISPILTALINNRHLLKMKKLELESEKYSKYSIHVRTLFEEFLETYGKFPLYTNYSQVKSSFCKCLPHVPKKYADDFHNFYYFLETKDKENMEGWLSNEILEDINEIIETSLQPIEPRKHSKNKFCLLGKSCSSKSHKKFQQPKEK